MSSELELLALRKDVLVARASLQRLRAARDASAIAQGLRSPRAIASLAGSAPGRSLLFGALMLLVGRGRVSRAVRFAGGLLAVVKVALAFLPARAQGKSAVDPSQPRERAKE
jgi:hypothetical protein